MPQGQTKKAKAPVAKTTSRIQTGNRVIKPKKASLIKSNQIKKNQKHSSGLSAMTEKHLASKAGHLELLAGGKRDNKKTARKTGEKQVKK